MTDIASMRARVPAQSVIEELLRRQRAVRPRSFLGRIFGRSPLAPDNVGWYLGAQGEIAVGAILERLPPEWATFHALPIGRKSSDIDHLVVGPGGIFTINTKHHRGVNVWVGKQTMLVGGHKVPHLSNAEFEASRVTSLLRERMPLLPPVQPVIAVVDARKLTIKQKPDKVKVVDARSLPRWLSGLSVVLAEPELDEVIDILDEPATWRPLPADEAALDTDELLVQFAALDREIRVARTRRVSWITAAAVALTAAVLTNLPPLLEAALDSVG